MNPIELTIEEAQKIDEHLGKIPLAQALPIWLVLRAAFERSQKEAPPAE